MKLESGGEVNRSKSRWRLGTVHAVHLVIWRTLQRPKRGKKTLAGIFAAPAKVKDIVLKYKTATKAPKKEVAKKYVSPPSRVRAFKRLHEKNVAMESRALKRKKSK